MIMPKKKAPRGKKQDTAAQSLTAAQRAFGQVADEDPPLEKMSDNVGKESANRAKKARS
jgi:hypothetical protein